MNSLFQNPIVKKLSSFKKSSAPVSEAEERWTEKAIKGLMKKLKKSPAALNDLEKALSSQDKHSKCVLFPRYDYFFEFF